MKILLIAMLLCLMLTGCGKAPAPTASFAVSGSQTQITLDAPAAPILEALGAPFGYGEQRSDAYGGVEKTYRFSGVSLRTYQSQDGERILGMVITGNGYQTREGICIGDTAQRVRECFGSDAIQEGSCTISRSREKMVLKLEHNVVTAIQYSLI